MVTIEDGELNFPGNKFQIDLVEALIEIVDNEHIVEVVDVELDDIAVEVDFCDDAELYFAVSGFCGDDFED